MNIKVPSDLFVDVWREAHEGKHNVGWVAEQLSTNLGRPISIQLVSQRAKYMRGQGVKLKPLNRWAQQPHQDVSRLNERLANPGSRHGLF